MDRKRTVDVLVNELEKTKEEAKHWCTKMNASGDYSCISGLQYLALNGEIDEITMNIVRFLLLHSLISLYFWGKLD